jgi:CheY-like chemotaxis protein
MQAAFKVLIADDSEDDRFLLLRAMRISTSLHLVGELGRGDEVINYLGGNGIFNNRAEYPMPDFLLLDGNMPEANAMEILKWLKDHPISGLKVVVLTGSSLPYECEQFLAMGADDCYVKSLNFEELKNQIRAIENRLLSGSYE